MGTIKDIFACDMSSSAIINSIEYFLSQGGDINVELSNGSLLHKATYIRFADTRNEVINYLLDKGININTVNRNGRTPLFRIIYWGNNELINKALDKGADVNAVDYSETNIIDRISMSCSVSLKTAKRIFDMVDDELISEKSFRFIIREMKKRYGMEKVKDELTSVSLLRFWLTVSL